jgi:DNA-3-methyladenine glycosylase I
MLRRLLRPLCRNTGLLENTEGDRWKSRFADHVFLEPGGALTMSDHRRCGWAEHDSLMRAYHDEEWGVPQLDSRMLWEMLMLEGFQAGLSWITILRKREAFRTAFAEFDPKKVARFGKADIQRLMADAGIVRARAKIEATIRGAQIFCEMAERGESFGDFCWSFTSGEVVKGDGLTHIVFSPLSEQISKEMKRRGFKFVGPTIVYAWMQAVGIVNDHATVCFRRAQVKSLKSA